MRFLLHLIITAAALWAAVQLVDGIQFTGSIPALVGVALVFGLLNTFVRPILKLLSLPFILLTLGLFTLVLNAALLWLTSVLSRALGLGFHVTGFWAAFFGALVVSIVSILLTILLERFTTDD